MQFFDFGTDARRELKAIGRAFATIEFTPEGKIITANENFCRILGYDLAEIKGRHHSMFVAPGYAAKPEYREFWSKLGRGEFNAGEFKHVGKEGKEVWIQASYNPVLNRSGKVLKVVKVALDVTESKIRALANKPLRELAAEFIFENSPDAYFVLDGGAISECNAAFEKFMGQPRDKLIGVTPDRLSPERQPDGRLCPRQLSDTSTPHSPRGQSALNGCISCSTARRCRRRLPFYGLISVGVRRLSASGTICAKNRNSGKRKRPRGITRPKSRINRSSPSNFSLKHWRSSRRAISPSA